MAKWADCKSVVERQLGVRVPLHSQLVLSSSWFRTLPFHGSNTGSNPVRITNKYLGRYANWLKRAVCKIVD